MSSWIEHGVQAGLVYSVVAIIFGTPAWLVILVFFIGFFDGSRADWLGDYDENHLGGGYLPYTPGNVLHVFITDPVVHKYSPDWWENGPPWLRLLMVGELLLDLGGMVLLVRELVL